MQHARIIVADSSANMAGVLMDALKGRVEKVVATPISSELMHSLESNSFDIAVVDLNLDGAVDSGLIGRILEKQPDISVIALVGEDGLQQCFENIKGSLCHCLVKPIRPEELVMITEKALQIRQLKDENVKLSERLNLAVPDAQGAALSSEVPFDSQQLKRAKKALREKSVLPIEKQFVIEALKRNEFNVTKASKEVGMQRPNFQALMRKHGLKLSKLRRERDHLG